MAFWRSLSAATCLPVSIPRTPFAVQTHLALVERLGLELPLVLETIHNVLVTPANFMRQTLFGPFISTIVAGSFTPINSP